MELVLTALGLAAWWAYIQFDRPWAAMSIVASMYVAGLLW